MLAVHRFQLIGARAPSAGATASNNLASAFTAALRVEAETPPTVVEPPDALSGGEIVRPIAV